MRGRLLAAAFLAATASCNGKSDGQKKATPTPAPVIELLPPEFEGRSNPLPDSPEVIARGRASFEQACSPCHGMGADGKGPAAAGLDPPPANFHDGKRLASNSDTYLFWRISTGRKNTAMPAFEGTLSEDERWAILRYLRSLQATPEKER